MKDYDAVVVQMRTGDYLSGCNDTIDRVLEIIELNKFCKHNDDEQAKEWNKWLDDLTSDIKTLKGDERK